MTSYSVIDASAVFKLLLARPGDATLDDRVRQLTRADHVLCAPSLWLYEITSTVTKLVHFDQLEERLAVATLELAHSLDIESIRPDIRQLGLAFEWTLKLNRAAAYDSFYLAAAQTLNCDLWTADLRLVHAANQPWVKYALAVEE